MKRSLLSRLRTNGIYYLISALLLLLGIPLYQWLVLTPQKYTDALQAAGSGNIRAYLAWISSHTIQLVIHHLIFALAFALLLTLPFSLFRIIVAQELVAQLDQARSEEEEEKENDVPAYAWRGRGFAVIAAWTGLLGIVLYVIGTIVSTIYLFRVSSGFTSTTPLPDNFLTLSSLFSIITNTVGIGLLALSTFFFGAVITRRGRNLWPNLWITFGYGALGVGAMLSAGAVAVASAPTGGQTGLISLAILLFALWVLWLGIMLVRLQPEP